MGKGGRGGKGGKSAAPSDDDDALLDAAIATANAERAQAEAERASAVKAHKKKVSEAVAAAKKSAAEAGKAAGTGSGTLLTMPETLAKLDRVMAFTICRMLPDGSRDACPSPSGCVTFYMDAEDAKADLAALQAANSELKAALDFTPLGRAFALTQGIGGLKTPGPTKIEFSRALVKQHGEEGVPPELRERMRSAGPFPLFYSDRLGSEQFTPVFFCVADLHEFWLTCGGNPHDKPTPTVTDLRIVVARTLQEPGQWEPLHYVPPKASEALALELGARLEREEVLKGGFTRGAKMLKAVSHSVAVQDGDEPPALS